MKVVMKPISSGTAQDYLERAKDELTKVLSFRGDVFNARVKSQRIIVEIAINPQWDSPFEDKVSYLEEWIPAKVRKVFEVISVSEKEYKYRKEEGDLP